MNKSLLLESANNQPLRPLNRSLTTNNTLSRKCACGKGTPSGESCSTCNKNINSVTRTQEKTIESLTPDFNGDRVFQTSLGDSTFSKVFNAQVSDSETEQLQQNFGSPSTETSHHCAPTVIRSNLPSGHIPAVEGGGRFAAPFRMSADFDTPIPCNGICGEYRQFVSGFSQIDGTDIVHPLCSNNMSRTTEHEDCISSGGTNLKYGYHSIPFATSNFINPDQATGWSYRGFDSPGFSGLANFPSGTVLNWQLSFRGELVDACDNDRAIVPSTTWTAGGTHTVA